MLTYYKCIPTSEKNGVIQVVDNCVTNGYLQKKGANSRMKAMFSAFSTDAIKKWLLENNPSPQEFSECQRKFTYSCAGYCVSSFVLGLGDRHCVSTPKNFFSLLFSLKFCLKDNIMISKDGKLFHIDFAYFLGHKTTFGPINRETSPFIFTPEHLEVIGNKNSENFKKFVEICCEGYNSLRRNANLILTLLCLMLSTGIPQLTSYEDIFWVKDALRLDLTEEEATIYFTKLIHDSCGSWTTLVNNA